MMSFVGKWIKLEDIPLSELRLRKTGHILSHMQILVSIFSMCAEWEKIEAKPEKLGNISWGENVGGGALRRGWKRQQSKEEMRNVGREKVQCERASQKRKESGVGAGKPRWNVHENSILKPILCKLVLQILSKHLELSLTNMLYIMQLHFCI